MPAAAAVATVVGGVYAANRMASASRSASNTQSQAAMAGVQEQHRQFDAIRALMEPYVNAGTGALTAQRNLVGLRGDRNQQKAIDAIQNSPQFQAMLSQGENSILQNASATGGLRGGNTQAALAQFSPNLLAQTINDQYSKYGGLTSLGQNAAAGVGNAGMQSASNVSNLLQQQGAAIAGGQIAGNPYGGYSNALFGGLGVYAGLGGFKNAQEIVGQGTISGGNGLTPKFGL